MDCICKDCHGHFIAQNEFETECFCCFEKKYCIGPPHVEFEPLFKEDEL
jgi:hypothetical protein